MKKKVVILSYYSGTVSRGVETIVTEIQARLKDKIDLTVYSAASVGLKPRLPPAGRPTILNYLYLDPTSLSVCRFTKMVLKKLEADPPDILLPLNNGWMSLYAKLFCRQRPTKLTLAGFSGIGWDDKVNLWLKPDVFICLTRFHASWAKSVNPKANLKTIAVGVNTARFTRQGKKFHHGLKPPVILTVAGPQKTKRAGLAIKAVAQAKNASLLLVGSQRPETITLGQKLLGNRFKNIAVGYRDLPPVYRSCQAYTLPALPVEAYGISILEALASGLPVVVTDDPIRAELVGRAGYLVDPTNLNLYASALKKALSRQPPVSPRTQALKFSWDGLAQKYLKLWQVL
ncbi:MAG: glycosyl transferase family 1 [Candidatus Beckwithbacteria bacterium GW2011_GWB1_47_15]|uniref:Glycosyl transferase family 1 n=1 Tax=Candidatus Beckwithbacteria bacterium GW2011_GWB1_47_15 TaxID=1618371 RepID=A0A0G1UVG9_9BACT|nr:MAG: Glycosyl transferase, group 1 [Candidatus Beckwithbacteria bacterium GW2011_GWC1_49_16]KKU35641.1 MAG: glycosyl transferase family 1 [Candidatus Beckwithbacteria bacterium GW2011_GWA1_46_30]KKU61695.1 MAG: glycosyl transferase family 1 [Candidatus Beckwithbacteria bacterium GW2011_GWB1_47_15]KKU72198.1 MAG: glycosyl transferase family 1 [Candidatus Beckwithbacteria bacterium GW2011_GWA2_47_25]KKW05040.1 MAG: glycosyl transferase family 1 [Candidatus Beckwithbacteria bacterium GW2011_GWC